MNISPENWGLEDVCLNKNNIYSGATGAMWVFRWKKSHQFENATQNLKVQLFFGGHFHIFFVVETKKNCEKKIHPSIFGGFYGLHLEGWKNADISKQRNTQELLSEIHALGRQLSMKTAELEVSQFFLGRFGVVFFNGRKWMKMSSLLERQLRYMQYMYVYMKRWYM